MLVENSVCFVGKIVKILPLGKIVPLFSSHMDSDLDHDLPFSPWDKGNVTQRN